MSQPRPNADTSGWQGQKQKQGGVRDERVRKSKSREPLSNRPSSLSQTGSMRSQPTQSAPGGQPIMTQLAVAQASDDNPEWEEVGEDSMDTQDAEYDDDDSSEESMEEDTEDAEDAGNNLLGDYGAQRPIETEYEFVESQPLVISLADWPTGTSDIQTGPPGRTKPASRVSRSLFTMLTNSSGDPSPAGSSIIPRPAGPIPVTTQHEQPPIRSRQNNAVGIELTIKNKARELMWDWPLFVNSFPDPITLTQKVYQCSSDVRRLLGLPNFPDTASHSSDQVSPLGTL